MSPALDGHVGDWGSEDSGPGSWISQPGPTYLSISILALWNGTLKGPKPCSRKADFRVVKEDSQLLVPWWLAETKVSLREAISTSKVKFLLTFSDFFLHIPPSHPILPQVINVNC